jgi:hypothetical protein
VERKKKTSKDGTGNRKEGNTNVRRCKERKDKLKKKVHKGNKK